MEGEKSIFEDMPERQSAYARAREEAMMDAKRDYNMAWDEVERKAGNRVGRAKAALSDPVGFAANKFVNAKQARAVGQQMQAKKGVLGKFRAFAKRVNDNLSGQGNVNGVLRKDSPLLQGGKGAPVNSVVGKRGALSELYRGEMKEKPRVRKRVVTEYK
jgi:hypothetical protein